MNIAQKFSEIAKKYPNHPCLADLVDGKYRQYLYSDIDSFRRQLADFLAKQGVEKDDHIAILLPNGSDWIIADLAIATLGGVVVPIHTTFNEEFVEKVLKQSDSKYLITSEELFIKNKKAIENLDIKIFTETELPNKQKDFKEGNFSYSDESDIHTIIYTSGTTGDPKGVMLTHKNLVSDTLSAKKIIEITEKDRFFSFLPLSHSFERTGGYYAPIFSGASIFFAQSPKTIVDDIKKAEPTVMTCVPRIFERIYEKIFSKVESGSDLKKKMFYLALSLSRENKKGNLNGTSLIKYKLLDAVVLKKIRKVLGGRVRMTISGGASLDMKIAKFFEAVGIPVIEGYGMTECSPIIAVNSLENYKFGTVGKAIDCNQVKISTNKEILVSGDNVMKGYYKNDAETGIIIKDGWLHTGDQGFLDSEGFLTIVGRIKEIIVLPNGKNIFPESIEAILNENTYILQSLVYLGENGRLNAIIVRDLENSTQDTNHDFFKREIERATDKLPNFEKIDKFILTDEEFTQENGMLTPTLKLKRKKILLNKTKII